MISICALNEIIADAMFIPLSRLSKVRKRLIQDGAFTVVFLSFDRNIMEIEKVYLRQDRFNKRKKNHMQVVLNNLRWFYVVWA